MHTNVKIGIGNASGLLVGGLAGYLVSRKLHKKAADKVADEILDEVVPLMFQTMTTMFTGLDGLISMGENNPEMSSEEAMNTFKKSISNGFEFFNLTMKDKYGINLNLEFHKESPDNE